MKSCAQVGIFTTLLLPLNFQMGLISYSVTLHYAGANASDKCSSLLGAFISYDENEVLRIWPREVYSQNFNLFVTSK